MINDLSDEELVLQAREREEAAEQLISRFLPKVESSARRFSEQVREDLVQEGLLALLSALKSFDADKGVDFSAYACVCMKNRMYTYLRRYLKNTVEEFSDEAMEGYADDSKLGDPDDIIVSQASAEELYAEMSQVLSPLEWRVFRLYVMGMPYKEIAEIVGVSHKTADNAIQRARKKLKALLK